MALELNGTTGVSLVQDGVVATADLADGAVTAGKLNSTLDLSGKTVTLPSGVGGKVLQVVQAYKTDTFSTENNSFTTVTGLAPSITPSSTSSKILILANVTFGSANSGDQHRQFRIRRDTTLIYAGDSAGNRTRAAFGVYAPNFPAYDSVANVGIVYLDSPNTTSAVNYNFQCRNNSGGVVYINRTSNDDDSTKQPRTPSSIILMEIEG